VKEPESIVAEIARVLAPSGLALLSTPNRVLYTERAGHRNPFHERELDAAEFAELLGRHFSQQRIQAQSVWAGSWIGDASDDPGDAPEERRIIAAAEP